MQQRLAALGVTVLPHQPPRTRAEQVRAVLGARAEAVAALLDALDRERYADGRVALRSWWQRFSAASRAVPSALPIIGAWPCHSAAGWPA